MAPEVTVSWQTVTLADFLNFDFYVETEFQKTYTVQENALKKSVHNIQMGKDIAV